MNFQKSCLIVIMLFGFLQESSAQEWEYLLKNELGNVAYFPWITPDKDIYMNVGQIIEVNGKPTRNTYIFILDKAGKLKGTTRINSCNHKGALIPYKDDQYISAGFNCEAELGEHRFKSDIRVFDKFGNLIKKGDNFGNFQSNLLPTKNGFISLKDENSLEGKWSLCQIDEDLKLSKLPLDLSDFRKEGYDFSPNAKGFWEKKTTMIVPFQYQKLSRRNPASRKPINSVLIKLNENKIFWEYPERNTKKLIEDIQKIGKDIAILFSKPYSKTYEFVIINKNGKEKKKIELTPGGYFFKMLVQNNQIHILSDGTGKSIGRLQLTTYDMNGRQINQRKFYENKMVSAISMLSFSENSMIITGRIVDYNEVDMTQSPSYSFIRKIDLDAEDDASLNENARANHATETLSIDEIDETALAVSVFPNPATILINIAIKEGYDPNGKYLLKIFSVDGKQIREEIFINNPLEVEVASLAIGTYIYQIARLDKPSVRLVSGKFLKV